MHKPIALLIVVQQLLEVPLRGWKPFSWGQASTFWPSITNKKQINKSSIYHLTYHKYDRPNFLLQLLGEFLVVLRSLRYPHEHVGLCKVYFPCLFLFLVEDFWYHILILKELIGYLYTLLNFCELLIDII